MKRALYLIFFACLVAEDDGAFAKYWVTPLRTLRILLYEDKPLVAPTIDVLLLVLLALSRPVPGGRNPMVRALVASGVGVALSSLWGLARGGSAYQVQFQVHMFLVALLMAAVMRRVFRTAEDYVMLLKVMIYAALYRAFMCVAFYVLVMRTGAIDPPPQHITSHDDSVLFVLSLVVIGAYALMLPSKRRTRLACASIFLILMGIQYNNRRIAWVSLVAALVTEFFALPDPMLRRRIARIMIRVAPVLAIYTAVGWGRTEPIFKPLAALSSVGPSSKDASTLSREAENDGLLTTLRTNPALGTGWGHEYIETDNTLAARVFPQYRYIPHNSVLAVLAFAGALGFACIWVVLPVCAYLGLRGCFYSHDPTIHLLSVFTLGAVVVCMNQMWGDMGFFAYTVLFILSAAMACASHLSAFEAQRQAYHYDEPESGDGEATGEAEETALALPDARAS